MSHCWYTVWQNLFFSFIPLHHFIPFLSGKFPQSPWRSKQSCYSHLIPIWRLVSNDREAGCALLPDAESRSLWCSCSRAKIQAWSKLQLQPSLLQSHKREAWSAMWAALSHSREGVEDDLLPEQLLCVCRSWLTLQQPGLWFASHSSFLREGRYSS